MNFKDAITGFVGQSKRVLNITHKPKGQEFKQIASITAIGIAIIGLIGFVISMISAALRGLII